MKNEFNHKWLTTENRDETLIVMWQALMEVPCEAEIAQEHNHGFADFKSSYKGAQVIGILVGDELAGGAIINGTKMHLAIKRQYRARWFKSLKPLMEWIFDRHGPLLFTSANKKNHEAIAFLGRVGCRVIGEGLFALHFKIEKEGMYYGRNR